nr:plant UBX domain-containing protein 8 [Ipomoea batatas]
MILVGASSKQAYVENCFPGPNFGRLKSEISLRVMKELVPHYLQDSGKVRPYPRRAFSNGETSSTLNELGLTSKQEALFLELI